MISRNLAFALGLIISTTLATPEFTNHGTTDGWSSEYIDPNTQGHITQVDNIAVSLPGTSLKFEQKYLGTGYTGRYHAEKHFDNGYHRGDHKFYGFSFRLQSDWDYTSQLYNIAQWGSDFNDVKCADGKAADDYSPSSMVYMNGTQLWTRVKYGQLLPGKPCPPDDRKWDCSIAPDANCQPTAAFKLADNIGRAQWYKLTFEMSWKSDATGIFKVWLDNKIVLDKSNLKTTVLENGHKFDFRVGLYANSWHDEHKLVGTQGFRQVWIDEIGVGSAKEDANPS